MTKTIRPLLFILLFSAVNLLQAQVYSNKVVGKKNSEKIDSLKSSEYPYVLPIWGEKASEAGYELPYSAGLSINYLWQKSGITIDQLEVGINSSELVPLDGIVTFNKTTAESAGFNIRPDVWLLPFLNVYGILAQSESQTSVDFSINAPNQDGYEEIARFQTNADFTATTFGLGITPTIGIGGGWLALDMNFTWTDIPELEEPTVGFVFDPRIGKTFQMKKKDRNISAWVGAFRVSILNRETNGTISLNQLLAEDGGAQEKIDNGLTKVDEKQQEVDVWWNGLSVAEKAQNVVRYNATNVILGRTNDLLVRMDQSLDKVSNSDVRYSLNKRSQNKWNFMIGSQFQYNKHWMIRAEYGFLNSRDQFIAGLQYRFGI